MSFSKSIVFLFVAILSSQAFGARVVATISCNGISKERVRIDAAVVGTPKKISYALVKLEINNAVPLMYTATLVPRGNAMDIEFASKDNGGMILDVWGDDVGAMSSIELRHRKTIKLQCDYAPKN